MNRRAFMSLLAGAGLAPAIGLPTPTEAAPALKLWPMQEQVLETNYRYIVCFGERLYYTLTLPPRVKWSHIGDIENWPVPAGTAMCYTDDDRVVKSAWDVKE